MFPAESEQTVDPRDSTVSAPCAQNPSNGPAVVTVLPLHMYLLVLLSFVQIDRLAYLFAVCSYRATSWIGPWTGSSPTWTTWTRWTCPKAVARPQRARAAETPRQVLASKTGRAVSSEQDALMMSQSNQTDSISNTTLLPLLPEYELFAFISHMGTSTMCGHYVCHIKKGQQ